MTLAAPGETTGRAAPATGAEQERTEWVVSPGRQDLAASHAEMERHAGLIRRAGAPDRVWLLEHPPVLTAGTSAREEDLLDQGTIPTHRIGRGGQWTYHGPGQRVGYAMLDLARPHRTVPARDVRAYVNGLERVLMAALLDFGIEATTREGRVGLWVVDKRSGAENKIAAIGVRVSRWVTSHGFALNVAPDLAAYERIVPCGLRTHGVTSLSAEGVTGPVSLADAAIRRAWAGVFGGVDPAP